MSNNIRAMLKNSLLLRIIVKLREWYHLGAIALFFEKIREAYPYSSFKKLWDRFCSAAVIGETSIYRKLMESLRRIAEKSGDCAKQSAIYKLCLKIWRPLSEWLGGGVIGRACRFLGVRGLLLMMLALYLPLDYVIRAVLPEFVGSVWDEALILAAAAYLFWHTSMKRSPICSKATTLDGYLILFFCGGFFLMCAVSPNMGIAVAGYRAVVEYMVWFFLVIRLIENDQDFAIFYGTLVAMGAALALHGIYQFIIAAPIPAGWVSQTEQSVRTRVYSLTGSPNIMGSLLVLLAPMAAGIAYYSKKIQVKVLAVCCTGLMCLSCIFTFSKGAWGGLVVAVLIFAVFLDRRLIALMGAAGAGALLFIPSVANRITYMFTADYVAASNRAGRAVRWSTGLGLLKRSNPLLGFGLGRFGGAVAMQNQVIDEAGFKYFYMDNYYLKTLVEMGYIGITLFAILLIGLILWCLRSIGRTKLNDMDRTRVLAVSLFSGMAGVLVHCVFENIFEVPYMTAYFWSMGAAVLYLGYFRKPKPRKQ